MLSAMEAFDGWMMDLQQLRRSNRTLEQYRSVVEPFLRWCGPLDVEQLEGLLLRRYVLSVLSPRHGAETLKREVGCIKTFGKWLEAQEIVNDDPFRKVKKPSVDSPERRIVSPRDAQAIFSTFDRKRADQARDYVLVQLTIDTAIRISEGCTAKLSGLNLES